MARHAHSPEFRNPAEQLKHSAHDIFKNRFFRAATTLAIAALGTWSISEVIRSSSSNTDNPPAAPIAAAGVPGSETGQPVLVPDPIWTATRMPEPSRTPTPRPTESPTASPTTAPATKTATPTPASKFILENGNWSYRTEKGELLKVPQISGLVTSEKEINGQKTIVYTADKNNKYDLKEGTVSGIYHPEAYKVTDSLEKAQQVGSVGLRSEVIRYFLRQAGSPEQTVLFPIPVDVSIPEQKILIQTSENTAINQARLFLKAPVGSKIINPIEQQPKGKLLVQLTPQNWGTTIDVGFPAVLLGNHFTLNLGSAENVSSTKKDSELGTPILAVTQESFPQTLLNQYGKSRKPLPVGSPNIEIKGQSYVANGAGTFDSLGISEENILKIGGSFISIISNDNPYLNN